MKKLGYVYDRQSAQWEKGGVNMVIDFPTIELKDYIEFIINFLEKKKVVVSPAKIKHYLKLAGWDFSPSYVTSCLKENGYMFCNDNQWRKKGE